LLISRLGLSSPRLSGSEPFRSAVPLAAAGIACLGITPTLGGPDRPLHWAMTAGMVGFGALLWLRPRPNRAEGPPLDVPGPSAAHASRALLVITALSAAICCGIVASRAFAGKPIAALSLLMPAIGLGWLTWLGIKMQKLSRAAPGSTAASDRPSRRPPKRDSMTPPRPNPGDTGANRHVSA